MAGGGGDWRVWREEVIGWTERRKSIENGDYEVKREKLMELSLWASATAGRNSGDGLLREERR